MDSIRHYITLIEAAMVPDGAQEGPGTANLTESRGGFLYHATSPNRAAAILRENRIAANTSQLRPELIQKYAANPQTEPQEKDYIDGVSLTRSYRYARNYLQNGVVLWLDQALLAQNYRMIPYVWHDPDTNYTSLGRGTHTESEEFVVGSIRNLDRYLVKVEFHESIVSDNAVPDSQCRLLMNHPLALIRPYE